MYLFLQREIISFDKWILFSLRFLFRRIKEVYRNSFLDGNVILLDYLKIWHFLFAFRLFWYIKSYNSGTEIWCSQGLGQVAPKHRGLTIPNHIIICSFVEGFPKYLVCCLIFQDIINAGPIFESSVHYFPRAGPYIGHCNNYSYPPTKSSKKSKKSILVRQLLFRTKILQEKSSEDNSLS